LSAISPPLWKQSGLRYFNRNFFLRQKFGFKVWRVSLDGGFTCPNQDGTVDTRGCIFCDPTSFSPSRRSGLRSIPEQLAEGMMRVKARQNVSKFVAYFQPGSNTYGSLPYLRKIYTEALQHPDIVGMAIGTRPDCIPEPILDLLCEFAEKTWLHVELGIQTIHDRTLKWMYRGHDYASFVDGVARCRARGLEVGTHVILGLPGESREDMLATAHALAQQGLESIKIHNLYAVQNTELADLVTSGKVRLVERDEYASLVVDFIERLPPEVVIDRITGDSPPAFLVGPAWSTDRIAARKAIADEFERRDTWQGKLWVVAPKTP